MGRAESSVDEKQPPSGDAVGMRWAQGLPRQAPVWSHADWTPSLCPPHVGLVVLCLMEQQIILPLGENSKDFSANLVLSRGQCGLHGDE